MAATQRLGSGSLLCYLCSSGNHAAALALAAKLRGIPAYIVVPNNAPACKLAAVKEYGGKSVRLATLYWLEHGNERTTAPTALPCGMNSALTYAGLMEAQQCGTSYFIPSTPKSRQDTGNCLCQWGMCLCAGNLILCEPTMAAREGTAAKVAAETGATFVPPYDYGPVIAGQGTIGLELLQQVPQLDIM